METPHWSHLVVEGGEQEEGGEAGAGQGVDRLEEQDELQVGGDLLEGRTQRGYRDELRQAIQVEKIKNMLKFPFLRGGGGSKDFHSS